MEAGWRGALDRSRPRTRPGDARLAAGEAGTDDFTFIDADKSNYDHYDERCLALVRVSGMIAFDNMLWGGAVTRAAADADMAALQALNAKLQREQGLRHDLRGQHRHAVRPALRTVQVQGEWAERHLQTVDQLGQAWLGYRAQKVQGQVQLLGALRHSINTPGSCVAAPGQGHARVIVRPKGKEQTR